MSFNQTLVWLFCKSFEKCRYFSDFVQKLARCLMDNSHCGLELIDLSNNNIEDRGAIFLSGPLPMMKAGKLTSLVLSKTG